MSEIGLSNSQKDKIYKEMEKELRLYSSDLYSDTLNNEKKVIC